MLTESGYDWYGSTIVGFGTSNNTLTLLTNTTLISSDGMNLGGNDATFGTNVLNITGGIVTNIIGNGLQLVGVSNRVVVSQGGQLWVNYGTSLGTANSGFGNQIMVSGTGSVFASGGLSLGGTAGSYNSVIVSNGAQALLGNNPLSIGAAGGTNAVVVTGPGSVLQAGQGISVGLGAGISNSLTIANGARVVTGTGIIGNSATAGGGTNWVLVTDPGSVWSNYYDYMVGNFYIGYNTAGNSLVVSNGAKLICTDLVYPNGPGGSVIGSVAGANNNTVTVTGQQLGLDQPSDLRRRCRRF